MAEIEVIRVGRGQRRIKATAFFNEKLSLRVGSVNNLYRSLECLWEMNDAGEIKRSEGFYGVFRTGLRLLAETAAKDVRQPSEKKKPLIPYIRNYAPAAKAALCASKKDNDLVTYLKGQSVTVESIEGLLRADAHSYTSLSGREQALAVSIFLAEMLKLSHGK